MMKYFVAKDSVVKKIWGKGDTILFIFAGSSAEFALNIAVDWLYFTGRLPAAPIDRLFSTVRYAREIVFSEMEAAHAAIDKIAAIHATVENKRGAFIPDWAYRDVLFMLIDYSIRSYELLERKLTDSEKEEVFHVFNRVGERMNLKGLPHNFVEWKKMRQEHLKNDLVKSKLSIHLYKQYKKHLGPFRYRILLEVQKLVVPELVRESLQLSQIYFISPLLSFYKLIRKTRLGLFLKFAFLPPKYKAEIKALDMVND